MHSQKLISIYKYDLLQVCGDVYVYVETVLF